MKEASMLDTRLHLSAPDDFYEALIAAHHGLEPSASHALNARLVLLLANQVGDQATLLAALRAARGAMGGGIAFRLHVDQVQTENTALQIRVSLASGDARTALYEFTVTAEDRLLAEGRATVMFVAPPTS